MKLYSQKKTDVLEEKSFGIVNFTGRYSGKELGAVFV